MGRPSKFPFSLSGRKKSTLRDSEEKKEMHQWSSSIASQNSLSLSKVERLLGTTGLPVRPSPEYDTLERATLNSKPSYMTLTVSEASGDDQHQPHFEPSPNTHNNRAPRYQSLRHQASSNVLGYSGHPAEQYRESAASLNTRDLRSEQSSATLRSYYDAHKAPLLVSQQTSESAIRDMALRKGLAPVIPTAGEQEVQAGLDYTQTRRKQSITPSVASTAREQRTKKLDITNFFPRPRTSSSNVPPAHSVFSSPSQLSLASDFPARNSSRQPAVLQKPRPGAGQLIKQPSNASSLRRQQPYDNPKNNVRRPPKGAQNWFDGLLEEVDDEFGTDEEEEEEEEEVPSQQEAPRPTVRSIPSIASTLSNGPIEPPTGGSRYFANHSKNDRTGLPARDPPINPLRSHPPDRIFRASMLLRNSVADGEAAFGASDTSDEDVSQSRATTVSESPPQSAPYQPTIESGSHSPPRLQAQPINATSIKRRSYASHNTVTSSSMRTNKLADMDLHHSSALSLSSSSGDESEMDDDEDDGENRKVRDSIAISEISADNVQIGKAHAFDMRPSHRYAHDFKRAARPMNLRELTPSRIAEELPPEPRSAGPMTTAPPGGQTLQSFAASEEVEEPVRPHTSAADTPVSSGTSIPPLPRGGSLLSEGSETTGQGHKLMAVTPEEEALLEMMRNKRVAMANHSFKEGYKTALQQEELRRTSRPPSMNRDSFLAAIEAVVQGSATQKQSSESEAIPVRQPGTIPESASGDEKEDDAPITADSTFTEIMDAFPAPSPTSNRFSTTFLTRAEHLNTSPGFSATSSSRQGKAKRHSNLSMVSSSGEDTSGTSATSSSPAQKLECPDDDNQPVSGDVSNASTIRRQEAIHRLSLMPVDVSMGSLLRSESTKRLEVEAGTRPLSAVTDQEQEHFGELTIGASESIVGNNDTDDLGSEQLHHDTSATELSPATSQALSSPKEESLLKPAKRRSMRIDVSPNPPSRPPSFAAPESPRKFAERRVSKGAEYRLIPKIPQQSPIRTSFPPIVHPSNTGSQLQNSSRIMSVPAQLHPGQLGMKSDATGRPRFASAGSAPAPNVGRMVHSDSTGRKPKPRNINIANVKKAFSVQRDPAPMTAPLPRMSSEPERTSKRFSRSSLYGKPAEGGKRSSVSEDVLNAWSSLGGWKSFEAVRGEA